MGTGALDKSAEAARLLHLSEYSLSLTTLLFQWNNTNKG
ncbi:unnamed protein product [Phytomonas sp. Hart1]|nr:unnamed protein product [Phytomonas sp. Hart1]|eukprot:CCW68145.1 unnamed protein product [Phytomonas sp. isolate Hart1]